MQPSENQSPAAPSVPDGQVSAAASPPASDVPAAAAPSAPQTDVTELASNASGIQPIIIAPTQPGGTDTTSVPINVTVSAPAAGQGTSDAPAVVGAATGPESLAMPTPSAWTDPAQTAQQAAQPSGVDSYATPSAPTAPTVSTPPTDPSTVASPAPATMGGPAPVPVPAASRPRSKKLLLAVVAGSTTLLLAGGLVFGWYLPNTPDNVWKTGMNRTGEALDALVQTATSADKLRAYKTSSMQGSVDVTAGDDTYSGTFQVTADKDSLDGGLNVAVKSNGKTVEVGADVLTEIAKGSVYPDVYFRLNGLSDLGLDEYLPKLANYDNKWVFLSADTLESLGGSYFAAGDTEEDSSRTPSAEDIAEVAKATARVTQEYVFTTDEDKAILVKRSFVGKEKTAEGVNAYHYKAGINSKHMDAYCIALSKAVFSTKAYQKWTGKSADEAKDEQKAAADSCKSEAGDTIKSNDEFDMWLDSKYKLVHKVRVVSSGNKNGYTDFGQIYKGGDKLSLFVTVHDGSSAKADGKLAVDIDLNANSVEAKLAYRETGGSTPYAVKATLKTTVSDKDVTITAPSPTVPAETFLDDVFGEVLSGIQGRAKDTERMTDVNALTSHLEAYYASSGQYPTLQQLNTASWRAANMPGLDAAALTPPDSTSTQLAASPSATQYGYSTAVCIAAGCPVFTVSALMSDGTVYSKESF